jgi:hypothetical protein
MLLPGSHLEAKLLLYFIEGRKYTEYRKGLIIGQFKRGTGYGVQDTGYRIQDTGYRIQDTGYRIQDTGYRIQDTEYRILQGIGYIINSTSTPY